MRNAWNLFKGDLRRLCSNTVTVIIVLGLVLLPSLFSWYNVIASWNVFGHTGSLTVAVANTDEGYQSDLVPLRVNVGEQVVSALRANDQLNWTFTSEEDAIDGARSGKYYAAVVIPEDFSRDMMTFYSADSQRGRIVYYSNEKKSAVAPKVTDQGADQVSVQVNKVFAETLSEAALGISSSLFKYADSADADGRIGELGRHALDLSDDLRRGASMLSLYCNVLDSTQTLTADSSALLANARKSALDVAASVGDIQAAAGEAGVALDGSTDALVVALSRSAESFDAVSGSVDEAFDATSKLADDSVAELRASAQQVGSQAEAYAALAASIAELEKQPDFPEDARPAADALVARLEATSQLLVQLSTALNSAADEVQAGNESAQTRRDEVKALAESARASIDEMKGSYETNLKPKLDQLVASVSHASDLLSSTASTFDEVGSGLAGSVGSLSDRIGAAQVKLGDAVVELNASADALAELGEGIAEALASGDSDKLREVVGSNPEALARALSAPVQLERTAVYPVENFGSAMSPLYTTLALWIGALLVMVALKINPSERALSELDNPTPPQIFLGRFGAVAVLSLMQSTFMSLGNLLFLNVQVNNPLLYLLCFWFSGLVFAFIIYTLVASLANFGKALAVFLLVVQVSGGGGSFPLQLLPDFFQALSPYLPATHVISAMRAAMFGVHNADFWIEMGLLALFLVPFALLGFVLRNPLISVVNAFVEKVESSKVM